MGDLDPVQAATLTREGFGSRAHRALWDSLVARDAADSIGRAIRDAPHADPNATAAARNRARRQRAGQARAYHQLQALVPPAPGGSDTTTALLAAPAVSAR